MLLGQMFRLLMLIVVQFRITTEICRVVVADLAEGGGGTPAADGIKKLYHYPYVRRLVRAQKVCYVTVP